MLSNLKVFTDKVYKKMKRLIEVQRVQVNRSSLLRRNLRRGLRSGTALLLQLLLDLVDLLSQEVKVLLLQQKCPAV